MTAVEWFQDQYIKLESSQDAYDMYALFEQAKEMEKWQRMKFEIPELSDEEIEKASDKSDAENNQAGNYFEYQAGFIHGAKWYREQLKQRQ